ncbi:MAG: hypothetical protein AAF492_25130, partial [Verrucomicrobiota bacterium]
ERIHVGFGTNRSRGGFIGKYLAVIQKADLKTEEDGGFVIELPFEAFKPQKARFPPSPVGQDVDWIWIQTVRVDAGLVIQDVEWTTD